MIVEKLSMDNRQKYLSGEKDATLFFDTFFSMCHKFKIDYEKASPKEKAFIDKMTRYNYELKKAKRDGLSTEKSRSHFRLRMQQIIQPIFPRNKGLRWQTAL